MRRAPVGHCPAGALAAVSSHVEPQEASPLVCYVRPALRRRLASALVVVAIAGCGPAATSSQPAPRWPRRAPRHRRAADGEAVVLVGRIVTMDDPPVAEALIEDGEVTAVGTGTRCWPSPGQDADHRLGRTSPTRVHRRPRPLDRGPQVLRHRNAGRAMRPSLAAGPRSASNGSTPSASTSSPPSRKGGPAAPGRRLPRPQLTATSSSATGTRDREPGRSTTTSASRA